MRYIKKNSTNGRERWKVPKLGRKEENVRTQADRMISERLQTSIEQLDLPDVTSISVYVKDGLVTIQGLVTSKKEVEFIADMAKRVEGVRHVLTHLKVVSPEEIRELEAA